jgi:flagellar hook-basal body complex protein FliE
MSIDPVSMVGATLPELRAGTTTSEVTQPSFTDWLTQQVANTNDLVIQADDGVRKLALGETDNLHQVMISLEKAKLSFELIVQVRNKLLDAYQDLMRMSI